MIPAYLKRQLTVNSKDIPFYAVLIVPFVMLTTMAVGLTGYLLLRKGRQGVNEVAAQQQGEIISQFERRLDTLQPLLALLLTSLILFFPRTTQAQGPNILFNHLTIEQGLSHNSVTVIFQDSRGFMWFGTEDGLNKYDGYTFTVYRTNPNDPHGLSANSIWAIYEDHSGDIWVGTWGGGLNRFDRETEQFTAYHHNPDDPGSLSSNLVWAITEDEAGSLWVGTWGGGLNRLNQETGQFSHFQHNPNDPHSLSSNDINSIYQDRQGRLWIGTNGGGLNRFDPATETFIRYRHNPNDPQSLSDDFVLPIRQDRAGALWLGTRNGGLNRFDPQTETFTHYQHNPDDPHSLNEGIIYTIQQDPTGALWVGGSEGLDYLDPATETLTHYRHNPDDPHSLNQDFVWSVYQDGAGLLWVGTLDGLNIFNRQTEQFERYQHRPDDPNSLSTNDINALLVDKTGIIWISTGDGLNRFDPATGRFTHYRHNPDDPHSLSHNRAISMYEDRQGILWVGTFNGLDRLDRETWQFSHYQHNPDDPHSLSHNWVVVIYEDRQGELWVGTNDGLNRFDRETEQFIVYRNDPDNPHSLSDNLARTIYEDHTGALWIGTYGGSLNRFDQQSGQFTRFQHNSDNPHSLSDNLVLSIYEDQAGTLWIGTNGGLNKLNRADETFTHYLMQDGLPSNTINGILEDEQGNLWLSTNNGLSKFNPQAKTSKNYDLTDGLVSNQFSRASARTADGALLFGSNNGFILFYPDQLKDNADIPPVVITDFQRFNKSVPIGGDSPLQKAIGETGALTLSYADSVISFEFAALSYAAPQKNRYRYMLEGFETTWNEVNSQRRFATYTNLDPGKYTFRVQGSNSNGVWNETGTSIGITVTPPWWETGWFRGGAALLLMGLVYGVYHWRVSSIEAQTRKLEGLVLERTQALQEARDELEQRVRERTVELSETNSQLKEEIAERKRTEAALQQYAERLRILHEIDQGILAAQSPEEIAEVALRHLRQLLSYHRAEVAIFDFEASEAETIALDTDIETQVGQGTRWPLTQAQDQIEQLRQGRIIFREQNPLLLSQAGQVMYAEGMRFTIYIPLIAQAELTGVLGLSIRHRREWSSEQEEIARQVADQLAIAIQQARLFEAEAQRRREAEMLREATSALTSTLDLNQVIESIMTQLEVVVPYDSTCLFLQEGEHLRTIVGWGFPDPEQVLGKNYPVEEDELFKEIQRTGRAIILPDAQTDPRFLHWSGTDYIRGWMGIPLIVAGKILGYLTFDSQQIAAYSQKEATLAQAFANQAAIAIKNAWLLEAERRQREIAEILLETSAAVTSSLDLGQVLLTLAKQLREISGFHRCILYGWEPGSNHVYELAEHARSIWSIEGGRNYRLADYPVIERVLTRNQPEITHIGMTDADEAELVLMQAIGVTALLTLPLHAGEQTIGLVEVGAVTSALTFDQTTLSRCQQNLQEVAQWLIAPLGANPHDKLLDLAKQLLEASGGSLCILSTWHLSEGIVHTAAEYNDSVWPLGQGPSFNLDDYPMMAAVLKQNESLIWPGNNPSPGTIEQEPLARWGERTSVVHPLSVKGKPIGLAEMVHFTEKKVVRDEELRLWRAVTDQATIAVENARLYERVQHYTKELEQRVVDRTRELSVLYDVTAVASEALDLQTTLERSLERVLAAIKSNAGLIHLLDETEKTLDLVVQQQLPPDLVAQIATISSTTSLGKHLIEKGEPLIVPDITSDPRLAEISYTGRPQTYVGLPMRASGGIVGVLSIIREATQPQFNVEEITLLTSIADQVGVVVESARLRQRAEQTAVLEERARLARELHDSVTQLLYSMNLFAKSGQNAYDFGNMAEVNNCLAELGDSAQQALKEMRLLVYELRPPILEQDGLVGALQHRLDAVEGRAGVVTRLLTNWLVDLPSQLEQELYHIALEALNNALKHAQATSVTIKIETDQGEIKLEVIDNGSGFDLDQVTGRGGLGLVSIRQRAEKLGGKLTILSMPGQGTTISVSAEVSR